MPYISTTLTQMVQIVKKTATALTRDFNELEHLQNSIHSDGTFAARSYSKALKTLQTELSRLRSGFTIVVDGKDTIPVSGNYFLLSPIDGFINFAHGNPDFAISLAVVENNVTTDAIVYNPIYDELFFAEKGSGAYKEGFRSHERLRLSGQKNAEKGIFACSASSHIINKALTISPHLLVKGSVAMDLAYLAAGKIDAVIAENCLPSTLAAGMLLVKEAGGYIFMPGETDVRSENLDKVLFSGSLAATNEALRQKIADTLAQK